MNERFHLEDRDPELQKALREKQSKKLLRFFDSVKNIRALHGKSAGEVFSSEEERRAFIADLQANEFIELLNGINGILRNKKKDEWTMDGEGVALESVFAGVGYVPPRQEDKMELLTQTLTSVKEMNREGRDLKDIALLISSSLNAIHPYSDANGRTSRLLYLIFTKNINPEAKKELQENLGQDGREKIDINPGLIEGPVRNLINEEVGINDPEINSDHLTNLFGRKSDVQFSDKIPEKDRELFSRLFDTDGEFLFLGVFLYLQYQDNKGDYLREFPGRTVVPVDILTKNITQEGLTEIFKNYQQLKKRYVELLIDIVAHPENEKYQVEHDGQKISLKNYFEIRIKEKADKIAEEDRLEKEDQEAEKRELTRVTEKESLIKEQFNQGQGEYQTFSSEEINSLQRLSQELRQITETEKSGALEDSLFELSRRINPNVAIPKEWIKTYISSKETGLVEHSSRYQTAAEMMKYLDNSGVFKYKFSTSKDYEIPFLEQKDLERRGFDSLFLDDLLSQSVYYVTESGSSLRLKLFNVKEENTEEVLQPIMERIFYSDKPVEYTDKKVATVDSEEPTPNKYVFEIVSPVFVAALKSGAEQATHSGVGIIKDEEGIYVDIPKGAVVHSGWRVVQTKILPAYQSL